MRTGSCPGGNAITISRDALDSLVIDKITSELLTPQRVQEIISRAASMQSNMRESASTRIVELKRQLASAKRKEANLYDLAAEGGVRSRQGFMDKLDEVQEEIASLQRHIVAQEELVASTVRPLTDTEAAAKSAEMRKLLHSADVKQQRRFVHAVVEKVIVKDDEVQILGPESTLAETAMGCRFHDPPGSWFCPGMVLPVRIELTTSALPRMRSTTELRQHCPSTPIEPLVAKRARVRAEGGRVVNPEAGGQRPVMPEKDERAERLAAALRENLRKRKAQARSAPDEADPPPPSGPRTIPD